MFFSVNFLWPSCVGFVDHLDHGAYFVHGFCLNFVDEVCWGVYIGFLVLSNLSCAFKGRFPASWLLHFWMRMHPYLGHLRLNVSHLFPRSISKVIILWSERAVLVWTFQFVSSVLPFLSVTGNGYIYYTLVTGPLLLTNVGDLPWLAKFSSHFSIVWAREIPHLLLI